MSKIEPALKVGEIANNGYLVGTVEEVVYRLGNIANREDINQLRIEMVRDLKAIMREERANGYQSAIEMLRSEEAVLKSQAMSLASGHSLPREHWADWLEKKAQALRGEGTL